MLSPAERASAGLVRAYWNLRAAYSNPSTAYLAVPKFLEAYVRCVELPNEGMRLDFDGAPYPLRMGFRILVQAVGDEVRMTAAADTTVAWGELEAGIQASHPGFIRDQWFWATTSRLHSFFEGLADHSSGALWQAADRPDAKALQWAWLALWYEGQDIVFSVNLINPFQSLRPIGGNLVSLPQAFAGVERKTDLLPLTVARLKRILKAARSLPAIHAKPYLTWEDLRPAKGDVRQRLAYYFLRDPNGPHLPPAEAAAYLGMSPQGTSRAAVAYERAVEDARI